MSRYTGPAWRISRRLGYSVLGTGEELAKRQTVPGQHGDARAKKKTEYGTQLAEKQKLRYTYGLYSSCSNPVLTTLSIVWDLLRQEDRLDSSSHTAMSLSTARRSIFLLTSSKSTMSFPSRKLPRTSRSFAKSLKASLLS